MKTAISIPDKVFAAAERLAKRLKKSRSQLYAEAIAEYVARRSDGEVTEALNRMCEDEQAADPKLDAFAAAASRRILEQTEW